MERSHTKSKAGGRFRPGRRNNADRTLLDSTRTGNSNTNFLTPELVNAIQHFHIGRRNVPNQQYRPGTSRMEPVFQLDPFGEPSERSLDMNEFSAQSQQQSTHSTKNVITRGRGWGDYHSGRGRRQTLAMGFKKLKELVESNEPEEFVLKISNALEAFTLLLEEDLSNDYVVLIMKAMAKLSESSFDQKKIQLLHLTCKEKFRECLQRFVMEVTLHDKEDKYKSKYFWNNPDSFFNNTHKYCEMLLRMIPSTALSVLSKLLKACTYAFPHIPNLPENTYKIFEDLQEKFRLCKEEMELKQATGEEQHVEETEPPDNFREISLFPLPYEITTYNKPFLRENIITGAYRSIEHYLDVQFRLVRNDFVKPLRDGISHYMGKFNSEGRKVQNVKLYHKVRFLKPELCSNATNGYMIQLPTIKGKKLNVKNENSRMFMYGTLVCFTKDNFTQILFGRIIDRKIELLKEGRLVVSLESLGDKVDYGADYLMVECKVYFEPYYYVLKALQLIDESTFPMMNYIIYMDPASHLPDYLAQAGERHLVPAKYRIPVENGLLNPDQWPSAAILQLNEAQYAAYKNALSREFAIIQGPPGTGKTYLGLKVTGAILANKALWNKKKSPMLVICYTNHALDQFLEGILNFTTKIVRIGGQSKNKNLDPYNIRMVRKHGYSRLIHDEFGKVKSQALELKMMYDLLDATKDFKGVVDISKFLRQLPELAGSWFAGISGDSLKNWLFGGVNLLGQRRTMEDEINDVMKIAGILNETALGQDSDDDEDEDFEAAFQAVGTGEEHKPDEDDDDIIIGYRLGNFYLSSLKLLQSRIDGLKEKALYMRQYAAAEPNYKLDEKGFQNLEMEYRIHSQELQYLQMRMEEGAKMPTVPRNILLMLDLHNPENIHPEDRWKLYFQWLHQYRGHLLKQIKKKQEIYKELYRAYEEVKEISDVEMMRSKEVVGMTTTSAARLQATLRALRSRIVIVEEAAEIMEAHIVTALTKNCEHLILIGDHQQLRPSTADYEMETKYNLGISLFERMVRNKIHCNVLQIQHRMRPDISKLIVPAIYPNLTDHESVHLFPNVKGIDRNLFFIDHRIAENTEKDESKYNMHEVKYMLALAQYILQNGYEPGDVTILCAYSAQLFKMFKERKNYPLLDNVRICVLDNYQGEESKIVLLSLVRNNQERKIGFLKIENRVCVALSRAREGFYIIGNMAMLSEKAEIWRHIKKTLEDQDSLGHALPVRCQIHQATVTLLETIDDFHKVAEGGCDQPCNQMLTCGHLCKMQCHILNREHNNYKCKEICKEVLCDDGHVCQKKCFEECGSCQFPMLRMLPCGHHNLYPCHQTVFQCHTLVSSNLPCGHNVDNKPCYLKPDDVPCPFPCDTRIEKCGHACLLTCHIHKDPDHISYACRKKCDRVRLHCMAEVDEQHRCQKLCYEECDKCDVVVKKNRSCGHVYNLQCSANVETMICLKPCKKKLDCGHPCKQKCYDECGNCLVKVDKKIEGCGHTMKMICKDTPNKKMCSGRCPVILSCGHQCQNICRVQCTQDCNKLVDSIGPLVCGHSAKIPCYLNLSGKIVGDSKLVDYCRNPCGKQLKCGHICSGSCGECYQGRIHKLCMSNCGVTLVCGHVCKTPCREVCPPCTEKCIYRCNHSKCNKNCGEPCTNCQERCSRRCIHQNCKALCYQPCTIPPCDAPCEKLLGCGHECVGFCGDPCPPLCRVCDNKKLTDIFFGDEDEKFARYVLLEDCKHVFESGGLEIWLQGSDDAIGVKSCPRCKTPIVNTLRYSDHVKHNVKNVTNVKQKFYGLLRNNIETGKRAIAKLDLLLTRTTLQKECPVLHGLGQVLKVRLQPIKQNKRQMLSKTTVQIAEAKIQVLENICNMYDDIQKESRFKLTPPCTNYVQFLVSRLGADLNRMTEQEIDDYEAELMRLRRMLRLDFLECRIGSVRKSLRYLSLRQRIYSTSKYDVTNDGTIKADLKEFSKSIGALDVSESELKEIVKVIGVRSGAWYKCPNGHPYAIGDCGGAMVVSKCADCGAPIGGQNHTPTAGNTHFAVDGSRHAAWSEQNNLLNYQLGM